MRPTLRGTIAALTLAGICLETMVAADRPVVIYARDVIRVETKGSVVLISIGQPKARQLAQKNVHIQLAAPMAGANDKFVGEVRISSGQATISLKFPNESAAASFSEQVQTAKAKSDCNCDATAGI